jgi:aminoglycoside phosphotransferase (APT) family kinase protein
VAAVPLGTESRNSLWRVTLDGPAPTAILKQYDPDTDQHAANRFRREEKVLTLLAGANPHVAPRPLGGFIGPTGPALLLMEDAGPRSLADELAGAEGTKDLWSEAADFVSVLHATMAERHQPLYRTAMAIALDRIDADVVNARFRIASKRLIEAEPQPPVMAEYEALMAPLLAAPKVMIHNSLSPLNIVRGPDGWRAIDWETLTLASPLWDWAEFLRAPYQPLPFDECRRMAVEATGEDAGLFERAVLSRGLDSLATVVLRKRGYAEMGDTERALEYIRRSACYIDDIRECVRRLSPPAALSQWLAGLCGRIE